MTVEFTPRQLDEDAGEGEATASGGAGVVTVRGRLPTSTPCQDLSATAARSGSTVTLTVRAEPQRDVMCVQRIGAYAYDATLRGLSAGTYTLRVVHAYPGTGWDQRTAFEGPVQLR